MLKKPISLFIQKDNAKSFSKVNTKKTIGKIKLLLLTKIFI